MKTGADISHHQATFDADRYYAAEDFVFLKATEAAGFIDSAFRGRWQACGTRPRGAYHFARPGGASVDAQADHFLAVVRACGWRAGDAWVLDMEDGGGLGAAQLVAWSDRWCSRVRAALGGKGLFYSYPFFVRDTMGNPGRIPGGCLGWWARYSTSPYGGLFRPGGWPDPPDVWQCSNGEAGCVKDVASVGRCDFNQMTDTAFTALFGGQEEEDMTPAQEAKLDAVKDGLTKVLAALTIAGSSGPDDSVEKLYARAKGADMKAGDALAQLAQLSAKVDALKGIVDGLALGRLEVDFDVSGMLHATAALPPPPADEVVELP